MWTQVRLHGPLFVIRFYFLWQDLLNLTSAYFINEIQNLEDSGPKCARKHLKNLNKTSATVLKPPDLGKSCHILRFVLNCSCCALPLTIMMMFLFLLMVNMMMIFLFSFCQSGLCCSSVHLYVETCSFVSMETTSLQPEANSWLCSPRSFSRTKVHIIAPKRDVIHIPKCDIILFLLLLLFKTNT